jgi:citrate synthase
LKRFSDLFTENQFLHEDMKFHFEGFPTGAHPMAILSAMINATSCFDEGLMRWHWGKNKEFDIYAAKLMSQVRTIAAYAYRKSRGTAADLSEEGLQIHGELPAHAVLDAV